MDDQVKNFHNRPLNAFRYPVLWVDALYEKVCFDGRVISIAIMIVCGVNEVGIWEVLAIESMLEESHESYAQLFAKLKERGLQLPSLIITDAHAGLVATIQETHKGDRSSAPDTIAADEIKNSLKEAANFQQRERKMGDCILPPVGD